MMAALLDWIVVPLSYPFMQRALIVSVMVGAVCAVLSCYLVLKGARTVIAGPDGNVAICPTGNPGMATAGTGDVLTGMIVGLLAQGVSAWEAACTATYFHGLAGDLAAQQLGQPGMLASDLIAQIPYALQRTKTI